MKQNKIVIFGLLFFLLFGTLMSPIAAQNYYNGNEKELAQCIRDCKKPYKILYILCTYCRPAKYNQSLDTLITEHHSDSIAFFPISAEFTTGGVEYLKKYGINSTVYFLNERKAKIVGLIRVDNPVRQVSDFIRDMSDNKATHVGAGGFVILDKNNMPVTWSDYKNNKFEKDYALLKEFIMNH